jgi:hypothetical protein
MKSKSALFIMAFLFMGISALFAQEGKISGYMFGDYLYEFSHPDSATDALNRNGFQFRRIYFTYDRDLSEKFAVRFRLEMNSPAFGRNDQLVPYVKHAYLSWKNLIPESKLYFGQVGTPTFTLSEEVWGYRAVEKTIMDFRGMAPSSDLGIALQGKFGKSEVLNYTIMAANGSGTRGETDKTKRVYVNVPIKIQKAYYLVPYFDYEGGNDGKNKNLFAVFAGIQKPRFHGGVEVFQKTSNKALANNADKTESGFSVFGAVKAAEKVKLFGRFDVYDPNTDVDNDGNNFIVAGFDFAPEKNVNVMPNVKIESYQAEGKDSNAVGALTFFFRF